MALDQLSTSYVDVPLLRPKVVPPGSTVEIAFVPRATRPDPDGSSFHPAAWTTIGGRPCASILVGPDGELELEPGIVDVWARVDAAPEDAWISAGSVTVR